ncbi:GntR family transcriptional regulator, partial [Methylopila musalis]
MRSSSPWPPTLTTEGGPLYQQIVAALDAATRDGSLRAGDRLPPQLPLAEALGVDLTTVTRAYAEARRRGLIDAVTGRGSFIAPRPEPAGPALDLSMNIPPAPRGVRLSETIARGVAEIAARASMDALMSYHPGAGASADRA